MRGKSAAHPTLLPKIHPKLLPPSSAHQGQIKGGEWFLGLSDDPIKMMGNLSRLSVDTTENDLLMTWICELSVLTYRWIRAKHGQPCSYQNTTSPAFLSSYHLSMLCISSCALTRTSLQEECVRQMK